MKWKVIPDYPDYEISENGLLRRARRALTRPKGYPSKGWIDKYGYLQYAVCVKGKKKSVPAHQLIALAFIGPRPSKDYEVAHGDGDKTNNHYKNLRWATTEENGKDKAIHGTHKGGKNGKAKLSERAVLEIRNRSIPVKLLCAKHGVTKSAVDAIRSRKNWSHL